jgi:hypothetical protein
LQTWLSKLDEILIQAKTNEGNVQHSNKNNYKQLIGRILGIPAQCNSFPATPLKVRSEIKRSLTGTSSFISAATPCTICQSEKKCLRCNETCTHPEKNCNCRCHIKKKIFPQTKDCCGHKRIIYFLDSNQKVVLKNKENLKLIITGGYGTGKSLLLKGKAIELAKSGEKVLYVIRLFPLVKTEEGEITGVNFTNIF